MHRPVFEVAAKGRGKRCSGIGPGRCTNWANADAESAKADAEGPLGRMLRDAGIEASPVSWTLCLGTVGAFAAFFGMRASGLLGAMLGVGLVCIAAALYVLRARAKRRELLSRQFVRLVPQLSASVKSSLTLERALRVSADHAPEPLRSELMAVLARVSYGMPLCRPLPGMAQSTSDADVAALASGHAHPAAFRRVDGCGFSI